VASRKLKATAVLCGTGVNQNHLTVSCGDKNNAEMALINNASRAESGGQGPGLNAIVIR